VQSNLAKNRDIQWFLITPFTNLEYKDPDSKWGYDFKFQETRHSKYYILGIILEPNSEKDIEGTEYEVMLLQRQ
jgi:hypothetical protein